MRSSIRRSESLRWLRRLVFALVLALVAAPASAAPSKKKQAAALTRRAIKLYKRGDYERAAALFLEAFELSKRAAQLRNAAKSYQEGGLLDEARPLWERYLERSDLSVDERNEAKANLSVIHEREKTAEYRETAEDLRATAERAREEATAARIAAEAAAAAPPRAPTITATRDEPAAPIGGYVLFGAGAGVLAAGAVLWFVASGDLADVDERLAQRDANGRIIGIGPAELESELDAINSKRVISGLLVTAGVVSAAGGIAWLLLASEDRPALSVAPTPGGVYVGLGGAF